MKKIYCISGTLLITASLLMGMTPVTAFADEQIVSALETKFPESEGYEYKDGALYFHDIKLNNEGMYEYVDASGQTWYYDPMDPEFLHYFSDAVGETDPFEEKTVQKSVQGSSGDTFNSGINGQKYAYPSYVKGEDVTNGIDVSYYQKTINWNALASRGVKYAIIRAGYRGYGDAGTLVEDNMCHSYIEGASAAGIKVGIYFLSQAKNRDEAIDEARKCKDVISSYKSRISLPVFIDYEYAGSSTNPGRLYKQHLSDMNSGSDYRAKHTDVINAFCEKMESYGYSSGVYCNRSMLETQLYQSGISSDYYIWMANYTNSTPYTGRLECWQYTSSYSGFGGYVGTTNVDLDFWFGSFPGEDDDDDYHPDEAQIKAFVTRLYRTAHEREPDAEGLAYWVSELKSGRQTGAQVVEGFYMSKEMLNKKLSNEKYVELAYNGIMGRRSDPDGKAYWTDAMNSGTSYRHVIVGFTGSPEFSDLCRRYGIRQGAISATENRDKNLGVTKYVSRLYTKALGRKYDVDGLNYWCGRVLSDTDRDNIIRVATEGFFHSEEFTGKNLNNSEYVKVLYRTFLGREYDPTGYEYWKWQLDSGEMNRDEVINGFAYSDEFNGIMASYGL